MKISSLFVLRKIADENVVIPIGNESDRLHGILRLNEAGAFLWDLLQTEQTEQSLLAAMTEQFQVDEETAKADIDVFLAELKKLGCLK